jgi:CelD/BcsL family acetyltransferase involved in cellulose biosynthesis
MHGVIDVATRAEWISLPNLAGLAPAWKELADRALEPNVFYEPPFALGAEPVFGRKVGAIAIWAGNSLIGLFPVRMQRRLGIGPYVLAGWTHPYAPLGTPLVDAEYPEKAINAALDFVARDPILPKIMLLPQLPTNGLFAVTLDQVLTSRRGRSADFGAHERALLDPSTGRATYGARTIGAKHRKELRRQRRRLEELGAFSHVVATDETDVAKGLEHFFKIEASGWKGAAGTAAALDATTYRFVARAVIGLARAGQARIDWLQVDERVIATLITLVSGTTAWSWKIAYDEEYARFSPGVQLTVELTDTILQDPRIERVDSCAAAHHPMIDHIWRERLPLADRMFPVARRQGTAFRLARMIERSYRSAERVAKAARGLIGRHR